ncbi:MAG: tyrosine--tRNA ligase [Patescibacteria group bacterium]|nr:tyrosine--tRNA ligase [Patescibacteria group bacterium]
MDKIEELLTRGVANIIPGKAELEKLLRSGKKLNVYLGIDPTATKIHLGHTVGLRKLQAFASLGHNVTFLIGDFTALIGDTSDKDAERPSLTSKEIGENFQTYKKQAEKVLDFSKVKIRYNSEWLKKLSYEEILKLNQHFSANDFLSRELIKKRISEGKRVGLHEFSYPVMQGYDSYFLDTDIQIGGTDQIFNMQAGRTLQKDLRHKESFVLTTPILEGPDGRKMSKSYGNAIWLDDTPNDMYAKAMAINDDLITQYFTLATNLPLDKISDYEKKLKSENPINIKKELAYLIVSELYDKKSADEAQEIFEKTVQRKELPTNLPFFTPASGASIAGTVSAWGNISASEVKRITHQHGLEVNGKTIDSNQINQKAEEGMIIKVGKKIPFKVKTK